MKYQVTLTLVLNSDEVLTKDEITYEIVEELDWAYPGEYKLIDSRLVVES